jgi:hypothetical protein
MPSGQTRNGIPSNGSETPCRYKRRVNRVCNGLLGLSVLLWAVTAGERTYARDQAAQSARTACAHEPARFSSKYQSGDCLRRSTARMGRRAEMRSAARRQLNLL